MAAQERWESRGHRPPHGSSPRPAWQCLGNEVLISYVSSLISSVARGQLNNAFEEQWLIQLCFFFFLVGV